MLNTKQFCRAANIPSTALNAWTEAGWIRPRQTRSGRRFTMIDLSRARLILDLVGPMGVNDEGVSVVLHLIDQVYSLRGALLVASTAAIRNSSGRRKTAAAIHSNWVEPHQRKAGLAHRQSGK